MRSFTFEASYAGGFLVFYDVANRELPNFEIFTAYVLSTTIARIYYNEMFDNSVPNLLIAFSMSFIRSEEGVLIPSMYC